MRTEIFRAGSGKDPAAPGVREGSRHTGRGSGRMNMPSLASMSAGGPAPLAPTYTWCQSCGLRYALAPAKRLRVCNRCGGSNPEDEGGAPERSAPGTHRPSLLRRPGGTTPGPDNGDPFRGLRTGMRVVSAALGRCRTAT